MTIRSDRREFLAGVGVVAAAERSAWAQSRQTRLVLLGTECGPVTVSNGAAYVIDCGDGVARQMVFAGAPLATMSPMALRGLSLT